ncbi:MAG: HAD-IIIC family phosphatase [Rhodocyclaceae bacterium]|nr:HAD-IIIC family phosphatase [Rhodocyclaceae bacterium]MCO5097808.1 HAD-IIIC family phosphatase [Rhodocyclaceae bacterium]
MPDTLEPIETSMRRIEAQSVLFSPVVSRLAVLGLRQESGTCRQARVNIWRNHAVEPVIELARPYLEFGRWQIDFRLGDYDDSLLFANHVLADLELLWLDSTRYSTLGPVDAWLDWLGNRIGALRAMTSAPIILATWLEDADLRPRLAALVDSFPGAHLADLGQTCDDLQVALIDPRTTAMAGSAIGRQAQTLLARKLASHWLPATLAPPIKAVALDLDNTLHDGVLGEDGISGVKLTPAHRALQQDIKSLRERGIFIALVSRNEYAEVEELFARRDDYPLRWDDFSAIEVSWADKPAALCRVAQELRIGLDAILFVDDNPGELASVATMLPEVHTLRAGPDAEHTRCSLMYYPALWRWKTGADDTKRLRDLQATVEREALMARTADMAEYFRSLKISLTFCIDPPDLLGRLTDLCNKTNQFNLALRRFNQAEIAARLASGDACVAGVRMEDRLSDSGVIAAIVAERVGARLVIEELCISCRALGRKLEDTVVLAAIRVMPLFDGCEEVCFRVRHGQRNYPALDWLGRLTGTAGQPAPGLHSVPCQGVLGFTPPEGVTVTCLTN